MTPAAFDGTAEDLLRSRSLIGLQILVVGCLVPLLTDLPLEHPHRTMLLVADVLRMSVPLGCLLVARRAGTARTAAYAMGAASVFLIAQGPFGTIWRGADNGMVSVVVAAGICASMAAFVPWGWRLHAVLVSVAVVEIGWEFQWQAGLGGAATTAFLLGELCAVFSLPFAVLYERDEVAKSRARERLRETRAAADALARELADRVRHRATILSGATESLLATCASLDTSLRSSLGELRQRVAAARRGSDRGGGGRSGADEAGALLRRVDAAADRMAATLDALLAYVELARCPLECEDVDLSAAASASVAARRERDPDRDVEVLVHDGIRAWGDPGLLGEAVDRLVDNAWKFSAEKPRARIEVRPWSGADGERGLRGLMVCDDGIGIDRRFVDKLFQPFERLLEVDEYPGLGIGLARVRRIAARHGGLVRGGPGGQGGAAVGFCVPARSSAGPGPGAAPR